ncbi:exopolysaccharide biosynthesis polyprenyl glycosylphosphotransferase [Qipengyuania sp.]|uniref:exopolysaccharide biosynthesis polyprenyl glycosylphosphotransferase n=1 Tax=Qipengyuania sp. TaxID=2004515 RepID=UPI0035C83994
MEHPKAIIQSDEDSDHGGAVKSGYVRKSARMALYARLVLGDALAILIAFNLADLVRDPSWRLAGGVDLMLVVSTIYFAAAVNSGLYSLGILVDYAELARRTVSAVVKTFLIVFALLFSFQQGEEISRLGIFVVLGAMLILLLGFRLFAYRWVRRELSGVLTDELVILDGRSNPEPGARFVIDAAANHLRPDLDDPSALEHFTRLTELYDRILVACPPERQAAWAIMLKTIDAKGELLVGLGDDVGAIGLDTFGRTNTLVVSRGTLSLSDQFKKRLFDLAIAVPVLIFLTPLLLTVALLIKIDSRGPVFFRQPRIGRNNVPFNIFKFRSMRQEQSDQAGAQSTRRDDDRISRFGAFIRKTSIDELPQLLNVIKGDMSIVGPRPHAFGSTAEDRLFWQISHRYWERHRLKPGITGLAQVRGYRGATETTSDLTNRLNADLEYLAGWRLWRDFAIIVATLRVLVHPNAY